MFLFPDRTGRKGRGLSTYHFHSCALFTNIVISPSMMRPRSATARSQYSFVFVILVASQITNRLWTRRTTRTETAAITSKHNTIFPFTLLLTILLYFIYFSFLVSSFTLLHITLFYFIYLSFLVFSFTLLHMILFYFYLFIYFSFPLLVFYSSFFFLFPVLNV